MKKVTLGFGRMNPPTTGHEVVANKIAAEAKKRGSDARLYLSHTTNPKKDPLAYDDKIKYVTASFGKIIKVVKSPARTIIEVAIELEKEGFTEMTLIVGADRVQEFNNLLTKYNGKDFNFSKIEVINAGERDPDADDVTGMSASKMRKLAADGDFDAFSKGAPSKLSKAMVKQMYDKVRKNMKIVEQFSLFKENYLNEELQIYSKWSNKEPVEYAGYLTKHFGTPDELTENRAIWYDKDGFKRIEVLDEHILHASPLPHYDFVYCYVDLKVPHSLATKLAESSESITVDFLKNEVGARCASLTANAVTLNYVIDVVEGRIKPSKEEYERQIKSMKNMFASGKKFELDWWPDESGDADPNNPFYKESVSECSHFHEACWVGYTQKGLKKKGNRMVPNCVPEENEVEEAVLTYAQRRARAQRLRRMQKRLQRARALQAKRIADPKRLQKRARRSAFKFIRKMIGGGKDYASLGTGQKIAVDKRLQKALPAITKISARLLPSVRRKELLRKRGQNNEMFEEFVLEKGPSRYYRGLDKETKEKRAAHFKKMGPRPDDDQSAYADAPGDKEAREKDMPQSQHTKKYKQMFGEEVGKKQMSRLDMLVRMGLADKPLLSTIKRAVSKLDSGETMTPQERKSAFDLLQTMLDMTLSTDQLFSMTRRQLQREDFSIPRALSPLTHAGNYRHAKMTLADLMKRKEGSGKDKLYYASRVAQSYAGVDAKKLANMVEKGEYDDYEDIDGLEMAQIEVANLMQDAELLLNLLDQMDEEPEAWVLSKITKAVDYIESVTDYLEFEDTYDYDDDDMEDDDDDMEDEIEEILMDMVNEGELELDEEFKQLFEEIEGLKKKAEKSGIPYGILKQVYNRGMAAWQGGHRPGTTPQQWAFARVNSFITKGKGTWGDADKDLAAKVRANEEFTNFMEAQELGTDASRIAYARMTPGQNIDLVTAKYSANTVLNVLNDINTQRQKKIFSEQKDVIQEAIDMHMEKKIPFVENVFRVGSQNYFEFFRQARELHESGQIELSAEDRQLIEETDIGKFGIYEDNPVPLDCPMYEEELDEELKLWKYNPITGLWRPERTVTPETKDKWLEIFKNDEPKAKFIVSKNKPSKNAHLKEDLNEAEYQGQEVELNQPKRGGKKKFFVYVKNDKGNVVKVQWGDTSGLSVKLNDPEARKSFAARHQCDMQKDRTSAAYWACNTPRYAKQLGLSGGGNFFW